MGVPVGGVPAWGVYLPSRGLPARGVNLPKGCTHGVYLSGGVPAGGCTLPVGVQNARQVQNYYLAPNFVWGR